MVDSIRCNSVKDYTDDINVNQFFVLWNMIRDYVYLNSMD
jgi:hypothetical protein